MTTRVCSDVPDATFVRAQAASNCKVKELNLHLELLANNIARKALAAVRSTPVARDLKQPGTAQTAE